MNKDEIKNLIKELIEKTTIPLVGISMNEDDKKTIWFSVETREPHYFLGRGGEALFALNHLARKMIENKMAEGERSQILIDINDFQKKRIESAREQRIKGQTISNDVLQKEIDQWLNTK